MKIVLIKIFLITGIVTTIKGSRPYENSICDYAIEDDTPNKYFYLQTVKNDIKNSTQSKGALGKNQNIQSLVFENSIVCAANRDDLENNRILDNNLPSNLEHFFLDIPNSSLSHGNLVKTTLLDQPNGIFTDFLNSSVAFDEDQTREDAAQCNPIYKRKTVEEEGTKRQCVNEPVKANIQDDIERIEALDVSSQRDKITEHYTGLLLDQTVFLEKYCLFNLEILNKPYEDFRVLELSRDARNTNYGVTAKKKQQDPPFPSIQNKNLMDQDLYGGINKSIACDTVLDTSQLPLVDSYLKYLKYEEETKNTQKIVFDAFTQSLALFQPSTSALTERTSQATKLTLDLKLSQATKLIKANKPMQAPELTPNIIRIEPRLAIRSEQNLRKYQINKSNQDFKLTYNLASVEENIEEILEKMAWESYNFYQLNHYLYLLCEKSNFEIYDDIFAKDGYKIKMGKKIEICNLKNHEVIKKIKEQKLKESRSRILFQKIDNFKIDNRRYFNQDRQDLKVGIRMPHKDLFIHTKSNIHINIPAKVCSYCIVAAILELYSGEQVYKRSKCMIKYSFFMKVSNFYELPLFLDKIWNPSISIVMRNDIFLILLFFYKISYLYFVEDRYDTNTFIKISRICILRYLYQFYHATLGRLYYSHALRLLYITKLPEDLDEKFNMLKNINVFFYYAFSKFYLTLACLGHGVIQKIDSHANIDYLVYASDQNEIVRDFVKAEFFLSKDIRTHFINFFNCYISSCIKDCKIDINIYLRTEYKIEDDGNITYVTKQKQLNSRQETKTCKFHEFIFDHLNCYATIIQSKYDNEKGENLNKKNDSNSLNKHG